MSSAGKNRLKRDGSILSGLCRKRKSSHYASGAGLDSDQPTALECAICRKSFTLLKHLRQHILNHGCSDTVVNNDDLYETHPGQQENDKLQYLGKHLAVEAAERLGDSHGPDGEDDIADDALCNDRMAMLECAKCGAPFSSIDELKVHVFSHSQEDEKTHVEQDHGYREEDLKKLLEIHNASKQGDTVIPVQNNEKPSNVHLKSKAKKESDAPVIDVPKVMDKNGHQESNQAEDPLPEKEDEMSPEAYSLMAEVTKSSDASLKFLQRAGCIHESGPPCPKCNFPMTLNKRSLKHDGYIWFCAKDNVNRSVRMGSIFIHSKLPLNVLLKLAFYWSSNVAKGKFKNISNVNKNTVTEWTQTFSHICIEHFIQNPIQIGGPDIDVQVDVVLQRRRNRVQKCIDTICYVGGYCPSTMEGFLVHVPDTSPGNVLPFVHKHVLPGSVIHTSRVPSFAGIGELDANPSYNHVMVNTSKDLVCPSTGEHVNHVELLVNRMERMLQLSRGTPRAKLQIFIDEFLWRERYGGDDIRTLNTLLFEISKKLGCEQTNGV